MLQLLANGRERSMELKARRHRLARRMRARPGLGEDDVVNVGEITCGAPGCADVEAVSLVMGRGFRTDAIKIVGRMEHLTDAAPDVDAERFRIATP